MMSEERKELYREILDYLQAIYKGPGTSREKSREVLLLAREFVVRLAELEESSPSPPDGSPPPS